MTSGCWPRRPLAEPQAVTASVSFSTRCTNTQKSDILAALDAASGITNNSSSYLAVDKPEGQRYRSWFGAYDASRWDQAETHFSKIKDAIDNKPLTFDCGCKQSYFAYVYPDQPYKVYLCKSFWTAPVSGTDSRAGTIVHELSHFNVVAGTDDLVTVRPMPATWRRRIRSRRSTTPTTTSTSPRIRRAKTDLPTGAARPFLSMSFVTGRSDHDDTCSPPWRWPLQCDLSVKAQSRVNEPLPLVMTLTNGEGPLEVLSWFTPFEGWFADAIELTLDDLPIPYKARWPSGATRAPRISSCWGRSAEPGRRGSDPGLRSLPPYRYQLSYRAQPLTLTRGVAPRCPVIHFTRLPAS